MPRCCTYDKKAIEQAFTTVLWYHRTQGAVFGAQHEHASQDAVASCKRLDGGVRNACIKLGPIRAVRMFDGSKLPEKRDDMSHVLVREDTQVLIDGAYDLLLPLNMNFKFVDGILWSPTEIIGLQVTMAKTHPFTKEQGSEFVRWAREKLDNDEKLVKLVFAVPKKTYGEFRKTQCADGTVDGLEQYVVSIEYGIDRVCRNQSLEPAAPPPPAAAAAASRSDMVQGGAGEEEKDKARGKRKAPQQSRQGESKAAATQQSDKKRSRTSKKPRSVASVSVTASQGARKTGKKKRRRKNTMK